MHDDSTAIRQALEALQRGEPEARAALLERSLERLTRLTRKMLRDFPGVRRWEQTDDVLQNAALRLHRALAAVQPPTVRDYFRLAAAQLRRELLDLARHYSGPYGLGAHHASIADASTPGEGVPEPSGGATLDPGRLALWTEFHQQAEALPDEDREVFDLLFYQGFSQTEAAALLEVSERTIKRRWQAARLRLHGALGGRLPGFE
jgi:RNA polymerase sigma-70 factor (ECF subfamily)